MIAIKAGRISDFNRRSISTTFTSQLSINPDIKESHDLKTWFEKEGTTLKSHSLSTHGASGGHPSVQKTIVDIEKEGLGRDHQHPDYILVEASITSIKRDDCWYTACPLLFNNRQCNKKVTTTEEGQWHCQRCNQTISECDYRYMFHFTIEDHTGTTNVIAFQEAT
jgi:replication factor A1